MTKWQMFSEKRSAFTKNTKISDTPYKTFLFLVVSRVGSELMSSNHKSRWTNLCEKGNLNESALIFGTVI